MCEQNLLKPSPESVAPEGNPRGRPLKHQSIMFSTQPKSIVSQLIQKMISQNKVKLPIENNSEETDNSSITEEVEADPIPGNYLSPKPKKEKPKRYFCEFSNCKYSTKLSCNLQKHKRTHTAEKPYLCDRCSFRTNFSNSLKVHKRLHTSERPYHCTICDYRCNSTSNLKKHFLTRHLAGKPPKKTV